MEIGSIFEIETESLFYNLDKTIQPLPVQRKGYDHSLFFNTGRSAIEALLTRLKRDGYTTLLLPTFICDSVRDAAIRAGMNIKYYSIGRDLAVNWKAIVAPDKSIFYIVQYFGQDVGEHIFEFISDLRQRNIKIIEDISLSLLSEGITVGVGDYVIGSMRKWFPITDGGILLSKEPLNGFILSDAANDYTLYYFVAQILKKKYLEGEKKFEEHKSVFLSYNQLGMESLFCDYTIRRMSKISMDLLKSLDYIGIAEKRIYNYELLKALLRKIPQVQVLVDRLGKMVPLGMVILVNERDRLFNHLISKDIYCNIHWRKNESIMQHKDSQYLSARCLTIPCDQRYGEDEMVYIYKTIKEFYDEGNQNV